jgi:hypothetical protein
MSLRPLLLGSASTVLAIIRQGLKELPGSNTRVFWLVVSDKEKKLYNIGYWPTHSSATPAPGTTAPPAGMSSTCASTSSKSPSISRFLTQRHLSFYSTLTLSITTLSVEGLFGTLCIRETTFMLFVAFYVLFC